MSSNVVSPSPPVSPTAHSSVAPNRISFSWGTGETVSGANVNKVLIPNAQTQKVMAETDAGENVVNYSSLGEMFSQLDS